MTTPTYPPQLTGDQVTLLGLGVRAEVAAPVLAWASLTNGQTFVTITSAGATDSRTINAALAASSDRPTFCAALAAELNTAGTTAYTWAVNTSSPVDGLIGTAKAQGAGFNQAPTGTSLVGGAGSITTVGSDAGVETIAYGDPVANAASVAAGDLVYWSAAGTLLKALNDTTAHADVAGAWEGSRICKHGEVVLVTFADTPTFGNDCYLSGTAGKATMTAPTASVAPRLIGKVVSVVSSTQALVALAIDVRRDKNDLWLLEKYVPGSNVQQKDFTLAPALWEELIVKATNYGAAASQAAFELQADGVSAGNYYAITSNPTIAAGVGQSNAVAGVSSYQDAGTVYSGFEAKMLKRTGQAGTGTDWEFTCESWSSGANANNRHWCIIKGRVPAITAYLRVYGQAANYFQSTLATISLYGRQIGRV